MSQTDSPSDSLLERFLRYVQVDTKSDDSSTTSPSSNNQLDLQRLLQQECLALGLQRVSLSDQGVLLATIPATVAYHAPAIAWIAHVDTSPEYSGTHVRPQVIRDYQGQDLVLPGDPSKVLRSSEIPDLQTVLGHTLVTTDGTTLLGGDDKAGVAVIMETARLLMADRSLAHGPIQLVLTCDEEIGRGTDHLDVLALGCACGYTLDGGGQGQLEGETFSADVAIITVEGINTHPSVGKGVMVNAVRILAEYLSRLPRQTLSPETTADREGFIHPYHMEGGVSRSMAKLILRDFETTQLAAQGALLEQLAAPLRAEYPQARITLEIRPQYRNMRDGLAHEPRAMLLAEAALRDAGLTPHRTIIRGGTDGSILTAKGLPTPNLSCGQHNIHSPLEWVSLDEMQSAVKVLCALAVRWGREQV